LGRFEGGGRSPRARFPKLHIKPFKQFEGCRTFTNFIEPVLPKKRTEQPWHGVYGVLRCFWQGDHQIYGHIRCVRTLLANSKHNPRFIGLQQLASNLVDINSHFTFRSHLHLPHPTWQEQKCSRWSCQRIYNLHLPISWSCHKHNKRPRNPQQQASGI